MSLEFVQSINEYKIERFCILVNECHFSAIFYVGNKLGIELPWDLVLDIIIHELRRWRLRLSIGARAWEFLIEAITMNVVREIDDQNHAQ